MIPILQFPNAELLELGPNNESKSSSRPTTATECRPKNSKASCSIADNDTSVPDNGNQFADEIGSESDDSDYVPPTNLRSVAQNDSDLSKFKQQKIKENQW